MKRVYTMGWLDGLALGAASTSAVFMLGFIAIDASTSSEHHSYVRTLLAATFTLFAAYIALQGISKQIEHTSKSRDDVRRRRLRAASAMLPIALSRCLAASRNNVRRHFEQSELGEDRTPEEFSEFDPESLSIIRECIEHIDDDNYNQMVYLFRAYQVLAARDREFIRASRISYRPHRLQYGERMRMSDAISWAVLSASIGEMFPFARGLTGKIREPIASEVRAELRQCHIYLENYVDLKALWDIREAENRLGLSFLGSENPA